MNKPLCAFICSNYQKELEKVIQQENFQNVSVLEYAPVCLQPKTYSATATMIAEQENGCLIMDNCILTQMENINRISCQTQDNSKFGNCLQMFVGKDLFEYYASDGGYLVSPGWLSSWRQNLLDWGFDQETAKQFFSEFANRIILLDTGADPKAKQNISDLSQYLGLPCQIFPVGLDHFHALVKIKINSKACIDDKKELSAQAKGANQQVADYALAFDLVTNLTRMMKESEAIREINNTFKMLFSPKSTAYLSLLNGEVLNNLSLEASEDKILELQGWTVNSNQEYFVNDKKDGFFIRISYQSQTLGVAEISDLTFPQYLDQYLNMALSIAPLFGLAISKARSYQQLEEKEEELQRLASTDVLTGLHNRRYFVSVLKNEFSRSKRYHSPLSIVLLDVDHFKLVNDTFGHPTGDKVLVDLAAIISGELRKSDIAARLGGDEFVILLPETNQSNAVKFANRLRERIKKKLSSIDLGSVSLTISVGIAEIDENCQSSEDILQHSDQALYTAKSLGRNTVSVWGQ